MGSISKFNVLIICFCIWQCMGENIDETCKKDFDKSMGCYIKAFEKEVSDEKTWTSHQQDVEKCFTGNGCEAPNFKRNPLSDLPERVKKIGKEIKNEWTNTSKPTRQCIKRRVGEKLGQEISKCLAAHKVENFNLTKFFSHENDDDNPLDDFVMGGDGGSGGANASKAMKKLMVAAINVVRSVRLCNESSKSGEAVAKCVKKECASMKDEFCGKSTSCSIRSSKSSHATECQARGETVFNGLCHCKQEKLRELVDTLDNLRRKREVSLSDLIEALSQGHDVQGYLKSIRSCYQENKESIPPFVKIAIAFTNKIEQQKQKAAKNGGGRGKRDTEEGSDVDVTTDEKGGKKEFNIDKATLDTIRDFLAFQAFDESECSACKA